MRVLNYYILTAFLTIFICYFDIAAHISSLFIVLVNKTFGFSCLSHILTIIPF